MKEKRKPDLYIADILKSVNKIEEYTKRINEEEFNKNTLIQDAILRRLEIIGEAVKNLPQEFKEQYTDIPWDRIAGMRNIVAHEYFGVNLKRVWKTLKDDIPELKNKIQKITKN